MKLLFFAYSLIFYSFTQSAKLDTQEVKVLNEILYKLRLAGPDFDKDSCSAASLKWNITIFCDCSFKSNTTCHVTTLYVSPILIDTQNISILEVY
ncbi:hypothetical protein Hanom_Chr16g01449611 [Helianthus anomalus]